MTTDEHTLENKVKYNVDRKSNLKENPDKIGDKIQAGVKAVGRKIKDPGRDLKSEYEKEKIKGEFD